MIKEKAKKIFEQYNRTSDVVRCPNGRASVRKQLDSYARAAVNLYGIISRDDFVENFNKQNIDQTSSEEIYVLLLPLVFKDGWYGIYKEYIVHYWFFNDFDQVDYLLKHQADKPRYVPEKTELLKYVNEDYTDNDHWWNVYLFMRDVFSYNKDIWKAYMEVKNYITYGNGISESVASTLQRKLPTYIETVLLPFKGKIIYDSFISTMPIGFLQGAKDTFREMYEKAIKHGIIVSLE